jgi:hypothetical protein
MNFNGENTATTRNDFIRPVNPGHIVTVTDLSRETLQTIVAHLEASTDFEHLVYREAELDAVWSITEFLLESGSSADETIEKLHREVHRAHDLVAASRPGAAAQILRSFLN